MLNIEASPGFATDRTLLAATLRTTQVPGSVFLMKSVDGGDSWTPVHRGLPNRGVSALAFSPSYVGDGVVLAGTCGEGLYRSTDGAESWQVLAFGAEEAPCIRGILYATEGRGPGEVYLWTRERGLYHSGDGGESWSPLAQPGGPRVRALLALEGKGLLLGTTEGLFLSDDAGSSWRRAGAPVGGTEILHLASEPGGESLLFAAGREALWRSRDGGATWQSVAPIREEELSRHGKGPARQGETLPDAPGRTALRGPVTGLGLLAAGGAGPTVVVATAFEIWVGRSGGAEWSRSESGLRRHEPGGRFHYRTLRLVRAGGESELLFVAGWEGLHRSRDGGRSWRHLELIRPYSTRGVAFSPAYGRDGTLFAATYGSGLLVSRDRGAHWSAENRDLINTTLDPVLPSPAFPEAGPVFIGNVRGLWWGDGKGPWTESRPGAESSDACSIGHYGGRRDLRHYVRTIELVPSLAGGSSLLVGGESGCIDQSLDGGRSWRLAHDAGAPVAVIRHLPGVGTGREVLAGLSRGGMLRSSDGGRSWRALPGFPPDLTVSDIEPSPSLGRTGLHFASTFERGVFVSRDAGETWSPVAGEIPVPVLALASAAGPSGKDALFAATNGLGVLRSQDAGAGWSATGSTLPVVLDLAVSPVFESDRSLLIGTPVGPFLSTDAGRVWQPVLDRARYEERRIEIRWSEGWQWVKRALASGAGVMETRTPGADLEFFFYGTGVSWIGTRGPDFAGVRLWLDDEPQGRIDLFAEEEESSVELYRSAVLPLSGHSLRVRVESGVAAEPRRRRVEVDGFDLWLKTPAPLQDPATEGRGDADPARSSARGDLGS